MRRDSLLRSTPLRLALFFSTLFVAAFLVTGFTVYQLAKWELQQRQRQTIRSTFQVIAAAYGDHDMTDLLDTVATNVRTTRGHQRLFLVVSAAGKALAGNMPPIPVAEGWSEISGARVGLDPDLRFLLYSGAVDGNRVVVGRSRQEIDSLEEIMLASFGWASIFVVIAAVLGGTIIASRARRRFDALLATMVRVSHGELDARVPLLGKGDDIDMLARDINDALDRLSRTIEGMRQVSADIAHQLKTPLNRLKITVEEALEKQQRGTLAATDLEATAAEADEINRTFAALLRIAQIESGARKARFAPVDLDDVLLALTEVYGDVADDAGQSLTLTPAPDATGPSTILGDRELITQMLANLIENAIRHCPAGTRIRLGTEAREGRVAVWIEDDGPGIPRAERDKVFRRFYRPETSRTSPGTGLGLSLVKAVADLHDAALRVEDAGPGLQVEVSFRRGADRAQPGSL